jgi:hypothetical protein
METRMKFLMLVATDPDPDKSPERPGEIDAWFNDVNAQGAWVMGDRLRPPAQAKTVRVRSGERMVIDGPFTASAEKIVGFDILECASFEEAIETAAKHPMARAGRIEVRAIWPIEES